MPTGWRCLSRPDSDQQRRLVITPTPSATGLSRGAVRDLIALASYSCCDIDELETTTGRKHRWLRPEWKVIALNLDQSNQPAPGGANSETSSLDASIFEGLARFRYALRQFLAFSEAAAQAAGVTSQQYQALLVIKAHPGDGIMIRDLADQMLLQHHGAVQLIDRLVSAGLVERKTRRATAGASWPS